MSAEPESATEAIDPVGHIVRTPGVVSGRPRIAGTRVRVTDVASAHLQQGASVEELVDQLDLSIADVHAALAYYYDHRSEIEEQERADAELIEQLKTDYPAETIDRRQ